MGDWTVSLQKQGERCGTPSTGRQSITGLTQTPTGLTFTLTLTPRANLESPVNLTHVSLDCRRKTKPL